MKRNNNEYEVQMREETKKKGRWETIGDFANAFDAQSEVNTMVGNNGTATVVRKLSWAYLPVIALVGLVCLVLSLLICVVLFPFFVWKFVGDFMSDFISDEKRKRYEKD